MWDPDPVSLERVTMPVPDVGRGPLIKLAEF